MTEYPATSLAKNKGKYYVLLTIPAVLREHFGGRKQLKRSTGTSDLADAKRRQHSLSAELYAQLDTCKPDLRDEGIGAVLGGIDTNAGSESDFQVSLNDRVLFDWQFFAGQYAAATIDAHLAAIREFEGFTGGACFRTLTIKSVDAYRQHLSERANLHHGEDALSSSSVRHKASHVKAFLAWLLNQSGCRRLPRDLADYLTLSRALNAQTLAPQPRGHPTMEAAIEMALGMPASSLQERRDQAIVAMAFVTGLRAGALSTLRLEHIDCTERTATQDGTLMRAKNGKSYVADWFATTEPLQGIVVAWIGELTQLGFEAKDAVFPAVRELTAQEPSLTSSRPNPEI